MSENGKWQLAFWVVTGFTVLLALGVINNDRLRASEDIRVYSEIDTKSSMRFTENKNAITSLLKENSEQHLLMMCDLREIKTKMGIVK